MLRVDEHVSQLMSSLNHIWKLSLLMKAVGRLNWGNITACLFEDFKEACHILVGVAYIYKSIVCYQWRVCNHFFLKTTACLDGD